MSYDPQNKKGIGVGGGILIFCGIVVLIIIVIACLPRSSSYDDDDYIYKYTPSTSSGTTKTTSSSSTKTSTSTSSSLSSSSLQEQQKKKADTLEQTLKADKQITFRSGYTFEQCVKTAHTYMKTKYSEDFYDTSVVVSTDDLANYMVQGYTKNKKTFIVWIIHNDSTWGVVTAQCQ